jgi:hypothetical protein
VRRALPLQSGCDFERLRQALHGGANNQTNHTAQCSSVLSEGDGPFEIRIEIAATMAASVARQQLPGQESFAALHALRCTNRFDGTQNLLTSGETGDVNEGDTTEPAIGGGKDRKNTADDRNNWRDEEWTLPGALRSSLSV